MDGAEKCRSGRTDRNFFDLIRCTTLRPYVIQAVTARALSDPQINGGHRLFRKHDGHCECGQGLYEIHNAVHGSDQPSRVRSGRVGEGIAFKPCVFSQSEPLGRVTTIFRCGSQFFSFFFSRAICTAMGSFVSLPQPFLLSLIFREVQTHSPE